MCVRDVMDIPCTVVNQAMENFNLEVCVLRLWGTSLSLEPYTEEVSDQVISWAQQLATPYCGPKRDDVPVLDWLPDQDQEIASLAVLPLRLPQQDDVFGLLVLASTQEDRFKANMGIDLLVHMMHSASATLSRLMPEIT